MISQTDALASTARTLRKQSQLVRMQSLATALLCTALGVLLLSARYEAIWPWLRWVRAFAEASAIGAIADWYAVVALFRRPLGLPIPHTAIIPANKDNIGRSLGEFVTQHLLTPENVAAKLERYDSAQHVAAWAATPANASRLAALFMSAVPAILRAPDDADVRRLFRLHVAPHLLELNMARPLSKALEVLMEAGLHRTALQAGLRFLDGWLVANEELVRSKFAQVSRYTPAPLDAYIVRKFLQGFRTLVHEIATEPAHAVRGEVDTALRELVAELEQSPRYHEIVRGWLRDLLEKWARDEHIQQLRETLAARAEADLLQEEDVYKRQAQITLRRAAAPRLAAACAAAFPVPSVLPSSTTITRNEPTKSCCSNEPTAAPISAASLRAGMMATTLRGASCPGGSGGKCRATCQKPPRPSSK